MLYDDELNVNKGLVSLLDDIKRAQDRLGVEFRLRGFIKAELFTAAQASAMFAAGFRWILVGFESGSPRILENINKKATRDENTRCMGLARDAGLQVKALMSIGHPGESARTIHDTEDWLSEVRPDDFDLTIITTYPGTPYYDHAVPHAGHPEEWVYTAPKSGDRLYSLEVDYRTVADYYKGDPAGGYVSFVYTDHISRHDLVRMRDGVESSIRRRFNIPFNLATPAQRYEHSMGQMGEPLPSHILRAAGAKATAA
jgi:anaerobic magnesium-protoporphyrin IX monomethyl ester cyclase